MSGVRSALQAAAPALVIAALPTCASAAKAEPPAQFCRHVVTDDTLRSIPPSLAREVNRLFGMRMPADLVIHTTFFRCMDGAVMLCNAGANLPCEKGNADRLLAGAKAYCRENSDSPFIPMYVTGHDTIYRWHCARGEAVAGEPIERLDRRGFIARLWKRAD